MAATSIFPGLTADVENTILNRVASWPEVLDNLSCTHRFAHLQLSNGKYYQGLFAKQHPLLMKIDQLFIQLKTDYPERCWKVAWCTMLKDYTPSTKKFACMSPSIRANLLIDQYFARNAGGFLEDGCILSICNEVFSMPQPCSQDVLDFCKDQFGQCKQRNLVLELFYHLCANGVHEHEWSEKHFDEFPQELKRIFGRLSSLATDFKKVCFSNSDLFLKCFVDEKFPIIKGQLSNIKKIRDSLELQLNLGKADYALSPEQLTALRDGVGTLIFELVLPPKQIYYHSDTLNVINLRSSLPILSSLIQHIEGYEGQG